MSKNEEPLSKIFHMTKDANISNQLKSTENISLFFEHISSSKSSQESVIKALSTLNRIIENNSFISTYFEFYNKKSFYIILFELFLKPETTSDLKFAIKSLMKNLIINIEVPKQAYDFLFQKLASIYRQSTHNSSDLSNILILFTEIFGDLCNMQSPKNYFCCSGSGKINIEFTHNEPMIGHALTIVMHFKIGVTYTEKNLGEISKLCSVCFSNKKNIDVDLKFPNLLLISNIDKDIIIEDDLDKLSMDAWNTLVVVIKPNTFNYFLYTQNDEKEKDDLLSYNISNIKLGHNDTINSLFFFENFVGTVSSIMVINNTTATAKTDFIHNIKTFNKGFYKKKLLDNFVKNLIAAEEQSKENIRDNITFIFTPFNYSNLNPCVIEDVYSNYKAKFNGLWRHHKYTCTQKNFFLIGSLNNFIPICEIFIKHFPTYLTEENFELYLKLINNIIANRKNNLKHLKNSKFFDIISLFFEKIPHDFFTEKILNVFCEIGKNIFKIDSENISSLYFKNIFLNEKILSKYNENLQIKFWNSLMLFCESDKGAISNFISMKKICLILRFYDRFKYTEFCCEQHLSEVKDACRLNDNVMNPSMNKKLSDLYEVLNLIFSELEPSNAVDLFKLLTLDLSPCLTKFILNLFIKAFEKVDKNDDYYRSWLSGLVKELYDANFETIITNTFLHSIVDVRLEIIRFIALFYGKLNAEQRRNRFKKFVNMLKTCFIMGDNFYYELVEDKAEIDLVEVEMEENNDEKQENAENNNIIIDDNLNKDLNDNKIVEKEPNNMVQNMIKKIEEKIKEEEKRKKLRGESRSFIINEKEDIEDIKYKRSESYYIKEENTFLNEEEEEIIQKEDEKDIQKDIKEDIEKDINKDIKEEPKTSNIPKVSTKKILIISEALYTSYISKLFDMLFLWSLELNVDLKIEGLQLQNILIKNFDILDIIFHLNNKLKSPSYTKTFFRNLELLFANCENSFNILMNIKVYLSFLDSVCLLHRSKDPEEIHCYLLGKKSLIQIFMNSFIYMEASKSVFITQKVDIILMWLDKILETPISGEDFTSQREFCTQILSEIIYSFITKYDMKFQFNRTDNNEIYGPDFNYYIKSFLILFTKLFYYNFYSSYDLEINKKGMLDIAEIPISIGLPKIFLKGMDINYGKIDNDFYSAWKDCKLFWIFYDKLKYIWGKKNTFKGYNYKKKASVTNQHERAHEKYEEIFKNIIINKAKKSDYQKELIFLCYEDYSKVQENISPLIKTIPIYIFSFLNALKTTKNEKDFLYYLKEAKYFIRFVILSSSNLNRVNQQEVYKTLQDKSQLCICTSLQLFFDLWRTTKIQKEKVEKNLETLLIFIMIIIREQHIYISKHKGKLFLKMGIKINRNDLTYTAIFQLFTEKIKDKSNNTIFSLQKLKEMTKEKFQNLLFFFFESETFNAFFENNAIKTDIENRFYNFVLYQKEVEERFRKAYLYTDEDNFTYKKKIFDIMPLYKNELSKYSNNSIEKNKGKKLKYRIYKENLFSWNGFWSDRSFFFSELSKNIKYKIVNHLTKSFMKPVLAPIFDLEYYLPVFGDFEKEKMFKAKSDEINNDVEFDDEKIGNINIDNHKNISINSMNFSSIQLNINKILEIPKNRRHNLVLSTVDFGDDMTENILRYLYTRDNIFLADKLKKISDNLDFGKPEEFEIIEEPKSLKSNKVAEKNDKNYFLCCLVKPSHHIKGVLFIKERKIIFKVFMNQQSGAQMNGIEKGFTTDDDDFDKERSTCYGSYFNFHPKDKDLYKVSIKFENIKMLLNKRYYYKNTGMEVFTFSNENFYFNLKVEEEREIFSKQLLEKLKDMLPVVDDMKEKDTVLGYISSRNMDEKAKKAKKFRISRTFERWENWKTSNFELLMLVNLYGNRSYSDISQYPIFPWILARYSDPLKKEEEVNTDSEMEEDSYFESEDFDNNISVIELSKAPSSEKIAADVLSKTERLEKAPSKSNIFQEFEADYEYRDLALPLGMLVISEASTHRKEQFIMNYETAKEDETGISKPFYFGTNSSNATYVCNFLIRLFPFAHIAKQLQGQRFDDPNRLFFSVEKSFTSSTTDKTDVRELIPEFYYLPEMFLNINNLNFGVTDDKIHINEVKTPCKNNPFDFVATLRSALENKKVSLKIQHWLDLVFGAKSRGKEAENAMNLYTESTYQELVDLSKVEDKEVVLKLAEFGMQPSQVSSKDFPRKKNISKKMKNICSVGIQLKPVKCKFEVKDSEVVKNLKKGAIIKCKAYNNENIMCVCSNGLCEYKVKFSTLEKNFISEITFFFPYKHFGKNKMSNFYSRNTVNNRAISIFGEGKSLLFGGFYDGKIVHLSAESSFIKEVIPFEDNSPITAVTIDDEEQYLVIGAMNACCKVYKIGANPGDLTCVDLLTEQNSPIISVAISSELNMFATVCEEGLMYLYLLPTCRLIRCVTVNMEEDAKCEYVFLVNSPIPSLLVICDLKGGGSVINLYSINGSFIHKKIEYERIIEPAIVSDINKMEFLVFALKDSINVVTLPDLNTQTTVICNDIRSFCVSADLKSLFVFSENGDIKVVKEFRIRNKNKGE